MRSAGWVLIAALLVAPTALAESSEPLEVPQTAPRPPEQTAHLTPERRIDAAVEVLRDQGYPEMPVLAWALLEVARERGSAALAKRALALAPGSPDVAAEAAWQLRSPFAAFSALVALLKSFPGRLWLATWGGAALGVGTLLSAALVAILAFGRTAALWGHLLSHRSKSSRAPAWPGVLILLAALSALPLAGLGPAISLALAAALAILRLPRREGLWIAVPVAVAGCLLGAPLDYWARVAAVPAGSPELLAAWRAENGQLLPGDRELLERSLARSEEAAIPRLALALAWKRAGRLDVVEDLVRDFRGPLPALTAHAANLEGIVRLAHGDPLSAIQSFERARAAEPSAPVLYNLSQANGRALRLEEQSALFAEARRLDADLVGTHTGAEKARNVHHYLIESPLPAAAYLQEVLRPSAAATQLANAVRRRVLGPGLPARGWAALPVLVLLALLLARPGISRCARCMRTLCTTCTPEARDSETCVRCARLFARNPDVDARTRHTQIARDRARQLWLARALALGALTLPGSARIVEGRLPAGWLHLWLAATGLGAWLVISAVPEPVGVGRLAFALPIAAASALLGVALGWACLESMQRAAGKGGWQ